MRVLRWFLAVLSTIAGWYAGLVVGVFVYMLGEWTCSAEYMVSGACVAPWSQAVFILASTSGAAVAAFLIVSLPAVIAPHHKRRAALAAFVGGCIFTVYGYVSARENEGTLAIAAAAVIAGAVSLWFVQGKIGSGSSN